MKSAYVVLLFLILSLQFNAQNIEETYAFGVEQYHLGLFESSELALERVLFFGEGKFQPECLGLIADMRMQQSRASEAVKYYSRASKASKTYDQQVYYNLRKTSALLAEGKNMLAQIDLLGISENVSDSLLLYRNFLMGVAYFQQFDFINSKNSFLLALPSDDYFKKQSVDSLFTVLENIKHPNPRKAKIMSMLMPGLGQFYSGDVKNGINSLLLSGAFLTLGFHTAIQYTLVDAFSSVLPWFQRYYVGGFKRAERIAAERLREKQNVIFLSVIENFE